jgi:superoxide dismutase, Cu-Zn family
MRRQIGITFGAAALLALGLVGAAQAPAPIHVNLQDGKGQSVGHAMISPAKEGVSIAVSLKGLPPGQHAIHVHAVAKCDAPGFTSAGPHFNPATKQHGLENPNGHHAGDMPNITVGADGTLEKTITNTAVTLAAGPNSLFANGGTALVIHAKADDLKSDPAGNAGDRIACGTITAAH